MFGRHEMGNGHDKGGANETRGASAVMRRGIALAERVIDLAGPCAVVLLVLRIAAYRLAAGDLAKRSLREDVGRVPRTRRRRMSTAL